MPALTLQQVLRDTVKITPNNIAIVFGRKKITYRQLNEITDQVAAGLIELGLAKGAKTAILLDNCPELSSVTILS